MIYFVQAGRVGPVKIGTTSSERQLQTRIAGLQIGNHVKLILLRTVPGGLRTEQWLHKRFRKQHIRGEWFRFNWEMTTILPPIEEPIKSKNRRLATSVEFEKDLESWATTLELLTAPIE